MKVILKLQTSNIVTEVILEANKSITLGRSSKSDLKVPDELMSSTHCRFILRPPKLEIRDLDSKNGTYLNGIRIENSDLFIGDEIKAGGTKITILDEKMDENSINALRFPGVAKDRVAHGLVLDFDGARMANQSYFTKAYGPQKKSTLGSDKELEVRKKIHSKIKLSKQEVKLRNKSRESLAKTIDVITFILVIGLPLIFSNALFFINPKLLEQYRLEVMVSSVALCAFFFYLLNFKILKFTIGEKLAGIQMLYESQD